MAVENILAERRSNVTPRSCYDIAHQHRQQMSLPIINLLNKILKVNASMAMSKVIPWAHYDLHPPNQRANIPHLMVSELQPKQDFSLSPTAQPTNCQARYQGQIK